MSCRMGGAKRYPSISLGLVRAMMGFAALYPSYVLFADIVGEIPSHAA